MAGNNVRATVGVKDNASSELDRIKAKFTALQKQGAKGFAIGVGAAATTAGISLASSALAGLGDAAAGAIEDASNLNEQMSKSAVVFGQADTAVEKFAGTAAEGLGLSKRAALEAASSLGNIFTGIGESKAQAADMSVTLVKLASDLASFNNIDTSSALEKLQSGLAGEARPLRELGVFLSEEKVKAKAMQMGLADAHGELSEGSKILARYQLILEETKNAQGDFARTSKGMANQQRILTAQTEDLGAELGQRLIPLVQDFQRVLIGALDVATFHTDEHKVAVDKVAGTYSKWGVVAAQTASDVADAATGLSTTTDSVLGKLQDDMGVSAHSVDGLGNAYDELAGKADASGKRVMASADEVLKHLSESAQSLIDSYFDPIENKYDLRELKSATVARIEELSAAKTVKAREKAKRALTQALDDEGTKLMALADQGRATAKDQADYAKHIKQAYGKIPPEIQKFLDKLKLVNEAANATVSVTITPHTSKKPGRHLATGGPGFGRTLVGELGPEVVDLPSGSFVHDAASTSRMLSRGGDTFNLTFVGTGQMSERAVVATVERMRSIARRRSQ